MRQALVTASAWTTPDEAQMIGGFHILESKEFICLAFARDQEGRHRCYMRSGMLPSLRAADLAITHDLGAQLLDAVDACAFDTMPGGVDLFSPIKGVKRLQPAFEMLRDGFNQRSARELIERLQPWFQDRDGNFARDFQTSGYSARVWELYLWAALHELSFDIDSSCSSPDFQLRKGEHTVFVEATTVNGRDTFDAAMAPGMPGGPPGDADDFLRNEMPIKFGSPLFSKLSKRYWEKAHVADHPLIFAVADFHAPASMRWSHTALPFYLYGFGIETGVQPDGRPFGVEVPIATHVGSKTIASNFFAQPDTEHVSAVLFSNAGTIVKFSRIGMRAGFGDPWVSLVREGMWNDPRGGFEGIPFRLDVEGPEYAEGWADELCLFHNPAALRPVDEDLFPGIAQVRVVAGSASSRRPHDGCSTRPPAPMTSCDGQRDAR